MRPDRCAPSTNERANAGGNHIAAVAVARNLTSLTWHMLTKGPDYTWVRPGLMARRIRTLELVAGMPARRGERGASYDYNLPGRRRWDRAMAKNAETAYRRMTQGWRRRGPDPGAGATPEQRRYSGCAAGLQPHAPPFATWSPAR